MSTFKKSSFLLGALTFTGVVLAVVNLDPSSGAGWVGKGDVQLAYGFNDKTMQSNFDKITFLVEQQSTVTAVCVFQKTTGQGTSTETKSMTNARNLSSNPDGDPRLKNNSSRFTGYYLQGYTGGWTASNGDVMPVVGGACTGEGNPGTYSTVTSVVTQTKLFASHTSFGKRNLGSF
jgi:hypothetical protein